MSRFAAFALIALSTALLSVSSAADSQPTFPPYEIYRPAGLSRATPVPLVLGLGGTPTKTQSGLSSFADRYGFVVAYPDPSLIQIRSDETLQGVERIQYVSNVIDQLTVSQNIDPSRVYVTGASKSAVEAYRDACQLASKITAVGSVSGALLTKVAATCRPSRPVSVMEIHGTADPAIPYNGTEFYLGVSADAAFWRTVDGCSSQSATSNQGRVTFQTWSSCRSGTAVSIVSYAGAGHGWYRDAQLDATAELWSFFSTHSSPRGAVVRRIALARSRAHLVVTVQLTIDQASSVRAKVIRATRTVVSKLFRLKTGTRTLRLTLPRRTQPGRYRLVLAIKAADGSTQTIARTFRVGG